MGNTQPLPSVRRTRRTNEERFLPASERQPWRRYSFAKRSVYTAPPTVVARSRYMPGCSAATSRVLLPSRGTATVAPSASYTTTVRSGSGAFTCKRSVAGTGYSCHAAACGARSAVLKSTCVVSLSWIIIASPFSTSSMVLLP